MIEQSNMSLAERLATSLGEKSQLPNKALGQEIIRSKNKAAFEEIRTLISKDQKLDILGDALKVVEVMGELDSEFTKEAINEILPLLDHKTNKIQWRAMSALSTIAKHHTVVLFEKISEIEEIMNAGSVITKDHGVKIMLCLYEQPDYREKIGVLLNDQVLEAPDNQLGQYAEKWSKIIDLRDLDALIRALETRQPDLQNPSHQKRIAKILKRLYKTVN